MRKIGLMLFMVFLTRFVFKLFLVLEQKLATSKISFPNCSYMWYLGEAGAAGLKDILNHGVTIRGPAGNAFWAGKT